MVVTRRTVSLTADEGVFRGLAKQNLLCHQCLMELIDNAIAATPQNEMFQIDIQFIPTEDDQSIDIYVADKGKGMTQEIVGKALQLGTSATTENRLNEHGFGLKNSLATLTGGIRDFKIVTKDNDGFVHTVDGPFKHEMEIVSEENGEMLDVPFLDSIHSTVVKATTTRTFLKSLQGRGARTNNLSLLRMWLIEHLGVIYRGYLSVNQATGLPFGNIFVSLGEDKKRVPAIEVPMASTITERFAIELSGTEYEMVYKYGTLDKQLTRTMLYNDKIKFYYQGNQPSQGIDIRLGKRVIATNQLEHIWRRQNRDFTLKDETIIRHNSLNDFVGELIIPELPRNILTTVNNKTDFNLDDINWIKIFDKLNEFRPVENSKSTSESEIQRILADRLNALTPDDSISIETSVWYNGTQIDLFQQKTNGEKIIYEIKVGKASPLDAYQLKMYWDGLLMNGIQPTKGVLLAESYDTNLGLMINDMNMQFTAPAPRNSQDVQPYNFELKTHHDLGLNR